LLTVSMYLPIAEVNGPLESRIAPRSRVMGVESSGPVPNCSMARAYHTTGLPPGATVGATVGVTTFGTPETGTTPDTGPTAETGVPATPGVTAETRVTADIAGTAATGLAPAPTEGGPLRVGQAFGPRYHIIKLLGAGGMGAVYQAWDAELNVAVALKVI